MYECLPPRLVSSGRRVALLRSEIDARHGSLCIDAPFDSISRNVRYWPQADMMVASHTSGGKADLAIALCCTNLKLFDS